mmetsp:Transcript_55940/g.67150  ORF Transcript_55940/g.67150 Transcript_55940/m.67150 type:complete len:117 (+) Transcript_55940:215-565(+)
MLCNPRIPPVNRKKSPRTTATSRRQPQQPRNPLKKLLHPYDIPLLRAMLKHRFFDMDLWVQCDRCRKWRHLSNQQGEIPSYWTCDMNVSNKLQANCRASEQTEDEVERKLWEIRTS